MIYKIAKRLGFSLPHVAALVLHARKSKQYNDLSYADEYKALSELASKTGITDGYSVDVAASDGLNQSCTYGFFKDKRWSGLCVEMDAVKFSKLAYLYRSFKNVRLARVRVTPLNVVNLLLGNEVPKNFELLNLDIDSYDLRVVETILSSGFRPQIISMEVNEKIPSGIFFTVEYDDEHYWKGDHFYGWLDINILENCTNSPRYKFILTNTKNF